MSKYIIEVKNAVKSFKENVVLNDVSINFERGKIHGIIGRNGSGKTVLFKCIIGFISLSSGEILINEIEVQKNNKFNNIGIIIETPGFLPNVSGFKNLKFLANIHRKVTDEEIREAITLVGLDPKSKKHVSKYSMGMRQRLAIAQAIMEKPEILILDEPLNGLDNKGVQEIRELFLKLKTTGLTIILASHNPDDIRLLCDSVHEMDNGSVNENFLLI